MAVVLIARAGQPGLSVAAAPRAVHACQRHQACFCAYWFSVPLLQSSCTSSGCSARPEASRILRRQAVLARQGGLTRGLQRAGHVAQLDHRERGAVRGRPIGQPAGDPGIDHPLPQQPQRHLLAGQVVQARVQPAGAGAASLAPSSRSPPAVVALRLAGASADAPPAGWRAATRSPGSATRRPGGAVCSRSASAPGRPGATPSAGCSAAAWRGTPRCAATADGPGLRAPPA